LRGCVAIIECSGSFLVLERSDGLGLCFPGGLTNRKESELNALRRELAEETGLVLVAAEKCFAFESDVRLPTLTTVFAATVQGTPRPSWEGVPLWLTLDQIEQGKVFVPHRQIVEYLKTRRA
jgi:8-oxo-dGTP pyrophosphatase MutT (NUDIX family)